jgi:hypothetical protein
MKMTAATAPVRAITRPYTRLVRRLNLESKSRPIASPDRFMVVVEVGRHSFPDGLDGRRNPVEV